MPDRDRDRSLQVRVAGHRRVGVGLGAVEDRGAERADPLVRLRARRAHVETHRRSDLVVARAARVDLPADVAELPLDRRMDVLVLRAGRLERVEPRLDLRELVVVEDPAPRADASRARASPPRRTAAAPRRRRAGSPRPRARARRRRVPPRASRERELPLARRGELDLHRGEPDEALRRVVRERILDAVRRERVRVQRVLGAAADDRRARRPAAARAPRPSRAPASSRRTRRAPRAPARTRARRTPSSPRSPRPRASRSPRPSSGRDPRAPGAQG